MKLDIWDTVGMEEYSAFNKNLLRNAKVVIIVFALDSPSSFKSIYNYIEMAFECADDPIIVLVGNKMDL